MTVIHGIYIISYTYAMTININTTFNMISLRPGLLPSSLKLTVGKPGIDDINARCDDRT